MAIVNKGDIDMNSAKKILMIIVITFIVISIQFRTNIINMNKERLSFENLENIFINKVFAKKKGYCTESGCRGGGNFCVFVVLSDGTSGICYDYEWPWQ